MYRFFNKITGVSDAQAEPALTIEKDETLWCYPARPGGGARVAHGHVLHAREGQGAGEETARLARRWAGAGWRANLLKMPELDAFASRITASFAARVAQISDENLLHLRGRDRAPHPGVAHAAERRAAHVALARRREAGPALHRASLRRCRTARGAAGAGADRGRRRKPHSTPATCAASASPSPTPAASINS